MTRILRTLSVVALLLFLAALGFLFFLRHNSQRKKFPEVGVGVRKQPMRRRTDPAPALSLLINREEELVLYRGTPMVLTVSIVNHRAMIADAQEKSDRVYVQQLRAAADHGKMPKENIKAQIARMELAPEVGPSISAVMLSLGIHRCNSQTIRRHPTAVVLGSKAGSARSRQTCHARCEDICGIDVCD